MDTVTSRIADALASELGHEAANTRRMLERVPEDRFAWKPHDKSMTLGFLASHLAELPSYAVATMTKDGFNIDPASYRPWLAVNRDELLAKHDANVAAALEALRGYPDDKLGTPWRLTMGDRVIFELPRAAVIRGMVLNHVIHHRGQLSVYLRLLDVPLPAIYGPTADEQ